MDFDIGLWSAAGAGLLSFLSPCILPIVPFYLAYMAGLSVAELGAEGRPRPGARRRAVTAALLFALGVATIFVGMGAAASSFGQALREWFDVLRWAAAGVILLMGLHFLGVFRIALLFRQARIETETRALGPLGAYVAGLAFAFGWTPCVGPVLAAILFAAAGTETAARGAALLAAYAAGMTLPFVLAAAFAGPFMRWAARFRRHLGLVEKIMGAALVLFAALIATGSVNRIAQWMLDVAPDIGTLR
ncbi:cytochrome c biogenesis CcdA family protein [Oceanicella actignis]|uniref:cytochrome c biogenesis CcdA family protein n=1 Tax=Oceanicella actignis TaxID=1189325 RepID=UPI0011E73AA4|nr:cytochrome c biogenesis protein CcdA [Oceanicella actignis]TYO91591.1 cytochrome c-type biogenesis protein [Oceanicella actignis]